MEDFEPRVGWSAFAGTDGAVWRYRSRGASGVVAITHREDGKRVFDATHNNAYGKGSSLTTESRRQAAWFAMKGTLEGLPRPRKFVRAPMCPQAWRDRLAEAVSDLSRRTSETR